MGDLARGLRPIRGPKFLYLGKKRQTKAGRSSLLQKEQMG